MQEVLKVSSRVRCDRPAPGYTPTGHGPADDRWRAGTDLASRRVQRKTPSSRAALNARSSQRCVHSSDAGRRGQVTAGRFFRGSPRCCMEARTPITSDNRHYVSTGQKLCEAGGSVQRESRPLWGGRQSVKKGKLSSDSRIPESAPEGCPAGGGFRCQLLVDRSGRWVWIGGEPHGTCGRKRSGRCPHSGMRSTAGYNEVDRIGDRSRRSWDP
jgi:hypothetical protein